MALRCVIADFPFERDYYPLLSIDISIKGIWKMSNKKVIGVKYCDDTSIEIKDNIPSTRSWDISSSHFYINSEEENEYYLKIVGNYAQNYSYDIEISLCLVEKTQNILQGITNLQATIWFNNFKIGYTFMLEQQVDKYTSGSQSIYNYSLTQFTNCSTTIKISYEKLFNHKLNLLPNFEKLLSSEEHADLKLKAANKTFNVHKCIISCRCSVLKKMIETNMIEKETGLIDLSIWDSVVITEMLTYIYTNRCEIAKMPHDLFRLAHFLELEELALKCDEYLQRNVNLKNIISTLELSDTDQYNLNKLKNVASNFIFTHEVTLVKDLEFQDYLLNNIQTSNLQFILRLANTHNLTEILTQAMEFVRVNYKEVLKNDECIKYLQSQPKLLLKIYEYSSEIYSTELVKMKNNNEESV